jgi:hypothetical protein
MRTPSSLSTKEKKPLRLTECKNKFAFAFSEKSGGGLTNPPPEFPVA